MPPLHGPTNRATMARQVTETPVPVRVHRPEVPLAVEQALERALLKDPAHRYPGIPALLEALQQQDGGEPRARIGLRSIAVLPFVNASPDPDNEYLQRWHHRGADQCPGQAWKASVSPRAPPSLRSRAPRSDVRAIGALLDVSEMLEGTVRKSGDRLRISVQLTSAADGAGALGGALRPRTGGCVRHPR